MNSFLFDLLHGISIAKEAQTAATAGHLSPLFAVSLVLLVPFLLGMSSHQRRVAPDSALWQTLRLMLALVCIALFLVLNLLDHNGGLVAPMLPMVVVPYLLGLTSPRIRRGHVRWSLIVGLLLLGGVAAMSILS